jgi:hypothetical protein
MIEAVTNPNQKLPSPEGRAIGFVDTQDEFDAVIAALAEAGVAQENIQVFHGQGSIELLEKNRGKFFLGDAEEQMMDFAVRQLEVDRYALSIAVHDRDDAMKLAKIAERYGAHSFGYFGTWVNERLTK